MTRYLRWAAWFAAYAAVVAVYVFLIRWAHHAAITWGTP